MSELVTIGGQSFIFDERLGWIDRKTKAPADENLLKLLNTVSPNRATKQQKEEIKAEETKESVVKAEPSAPPVPVVPGTVAQPNRMSGLKTKIMKGVDPVNIGGQRFVYSNNGWVDEKSKQPAPENLIKLLDTLVPTAKDSLGAIGEIQAQKINNKKTKEISTPKINRLFIKMIDELAIIDSYFASKVKSIKVESAGTMLSRRENMIESSDKAEEIVAKSEKGTSTLTKLGGAAGLAALIAVAYDPLFKEIKKVYDYTKDVGEYVSSFAKKVNGFLEWFGDKNNATKFTIDHPEVMSEQEYTKMKDDKLNTASEATVPVMLAKPELKAPSGELKSTPISNPWASAMTPSPTAKPSFVRRPVPQQSATVASNQKWTESLSPKSTIMKPRGAERANAQVKQQTSKLGSNIPQNDLHGLRKWLIANGFTPSEQKGYDKVGGHSKNSKHYSGDAIDVNVYPNGKAIVEANDPVYGPKFDILAKQLKDAGYSVIWRAPGHDNHLHVSTGGPSNIGSGGVGDMIDSVKQVAEESFNEFIKMIKAVGSTDTVFTPLGSKKHLKIEKAQSEKNRQIVDSKTKKEAPVMELPNLNIGGGTVHTPKRSSDSTGVINQYITYFD